MGAHAKKRGGGRRAMAVGTMVGGFVLASPGAAFAADVLPGEGQGSTPQQRQSMGSDARVGNDFDPSTGTFRHSYDWKNPMPASPVQFPWFNSPQVLPKDLGPSQHGLYRHDPLNRDGSDGFEHSGRTDANTVGSTFGGSGYGDHLFAVTMGCPRHAKRTGPDGRPSHENHDGYWTGATTFNPQERRLHFSYQMGDTTFDDAWLLGHDAFWGVYSGPHHS